MLCFHSKFVFQNLYRSDIVQWFWRAMKKGWTVTLAGTYSDQIPDVQMHLSFPKRSSSQSRKLDKSTHSHQSIDQPKDTDMDLDTNSNYNDTDSQKPEPKPAILPPSTPQSIKLNPKRSLTKNYFNAGICSFEIRNDKKAHRHMNMIWFFCIFFGYLPANRCIFRPSAATATT